MLDALKVGYRLIVLPFGSEYGRMVWQNGRREKETEGLHEGKEKLVNRVKIKFRIFIFSGSLVNDGLPLFYSSFKGGPWKTEKICYSKRICSTISAASRMQSAQGRRTVPVSTPFNSLQIDA